MLLLEFEMCCLCDTTVNDDTISEFEQEFIRLEGVCVDCKLGVEDDVEVHLHTTIRQPIRVEVVA